MKKCLLVFSGLFGLIFFVNAIPVSLYLGTSNSFSFPIIRGDLHSALTSFGFSGTSEVGVDILGWQFGGLFNAALWGSGDGKDGLMKNFMAIQIGLAINKEFDNSLIPIFPDWFGFHSAFSVRYGIFHTEHFRTSQAKIAGNYNHEWDQVLFLNTGLFLDFHPGNYATLFIGGDVTGWKDEDTIVFTPSITAGVKVHPDRKKYLEEKKRIFRRNKKNENQEKLEADLAVPNEYFKEKDIFMSFYLSANIPENTACKNWKLEIFDSDNRLFFSTGADLEIPPVIDWNGFGNNSDFITLGSNYFCKFTVTDDKGNIAEDMEKIFATFSIKDLEENLIKIQTAPIIFSANRSSLEEVSPNQKIKNDKILDDVANFLKKYPYSHICIVGHANNVRRMEEDEETLWIPLSKARTEEVCNALIERGIIADKITTEAKGGRFPVSINDFEVWKNRRVEFLVKTIPEGARDEK